MTNAVEPHSTPVADSLKNLGCFVSVQNLNFFLQRVSLNQTVLVTCAVCRETAEMRSLTSFLGKT